MVALKFVLNNYQTDTVKCLNLVLSKLTTGQKKAPVSCLAD